MVYGGVVPVVFPLAPLLALLNNIWEARLDILKLKVRRRGVRVGVAPREERQAHLPFSLTLEGRQAAP